MLCFFLVVLERNLHSSVRVLQNSNVYVDVHRRPLFAQHDHSDSFPRVYIHQGVLLCWLDSTGYYDIHLVGSDDHQTGTIVSIFKKFRIRYKQILSAHSKSMNCYNSLCASCTIQGVPTNPTLKCPSDDSNRHS